MKFLVSPALIGASLTFCVAAACVTTEGTRRTGSAVEYVMLTPSEGPAMRVASVSRSARQLPARRADRHQRETQRPDVDPDTVPAPRPAVESGERVGIVRPYSTRRFFRGFGRCVGNHHYHPAIDLGGVGPDWGIGTPIKAMTRARIKYIGRPHDKPGEFGVPDKRRGKVRRGGKLLPRSKVIPGYGRVYFFTRTKGRWRSGTVIVTEGMGGSLDGHTVRYMHLGAVKPGLKVGDVVAAGAEIGVMGGTGVMQSAPHVHIDIEDPDGRRVDVAPLLGLSPTAEACPKPVAKGGHRVYKKSAKVPACGEWTRDEDFQSGEFYAHDVKVRVKKGKSLKARLSRTSGYWRPRLEILDSSGKPVDNGSAISGRRGKLMARRTKSGRSGPEAAVTIEASRDMELTIRATAWPRRRPGLLLPRDGAYRLSLSEQCRGAEAALPEAEAVARTSR